MLICAECGSVFEMARTLFERHGHETTSFEELNVCPNCESTNIHAAHRCEVCGDWITGKHIRLMTGERICESCYSLNTIDDD